MLSFDTEAEMLVAWREFLVQTDPDVITGYNINNFDTPYLINRAEALKIRSFPFLGRVANMPSKIKDKTFQSKQVGTRESKEVNMEGRVQFDVMQILQRDYKLSSYSLNSVLTRTLTRTRTRTRTLTRTLTLTLTNPNPSPLTLALTLTLTLTRCRRTSWASRRRTCTTRRSRCCRTATRTRAGG